MGRKLGELLVAEGRISEAVLARALELQGTQSRGLRLGAILLRWGLVSEKALLDSLAITGPFKRVWIFDEYAKALVWRSRSSE